MSTWTFPGVKSGWGVTLTPHPLLVPWSRKGTAISPTPPMGRTACTEAQCLYKCALYLLLYLFFWLSKQNPAHILCFYMFYMYLSGSPRFSYFKTKNVKIINNFLISGTQLSLYKSACIYMAYFLMLLLSDVSRSSTMWWVGSRGLHGGKGKCIQVSGKKNMKEREHFEAKHRQNENSHSCYYMWFINTNWL